MSEASRPRPEASALPRTFRPRSQGISSVPGKKNTIFSDKSNRLQAELLVLPNDRKDYIACFVDLVLLVLLRGTGYNLKNSITGQKNGNSFFA